MRNRIDKELTMALLLASALLTSTPGTPQTSSSRNEKDITKRVALGRRPLWTTSGAWNAAGRELLLVDVLRGEILRYSRAGEFWGTHSLRGVVRIEALKKGFLLELQGNRFARVDARLNVIDSINPLGARQKDGAILRSIFQWASAGDDLVVFGDIQSSSGRWSSGFLRVPLKKPDSFEVLQSLELSDPSRGFYLLGHPLIASVDGAAYFLVMKDLPALYEWRYGGSRLRRLAAFPLDSSVMPVLPSWEKREEAPMIMRTIEGATVPVGLYGWEGGLYVLWRRPEGARTRWNLTLINPQRDRVVWTSRLPSRANHLLVVPGRENWFVFEKGPVLELGVQEIDKLLVIPSSSLNRCFIGAGD